MEVQETHGSEESQQKLKLRREARRRKILENAKNRLEKLNMRQSGEGDTEILKECSNHQLQQDIEYSDPEVEPNIPEPQHMPFQQFDENFLKGFESSLNRQDTREKENTFIKFKLHVILAVTVAYVASVLLNTSAGTKFFAVIPVALVIISDLTIFRQQNQRSPLINMLVIFGIRSQEIVHALDIVSNLQNVLADLSIYIFYFCIATCVGNQFVHLADIK
ncbi:uncharacterized protein LOC101456684 [Ceratitis capitata]|uniref:uncharacterized protein LOC101456684 n=1 Tax=Ceratitis capitata TaxID=7213 RepID=UPI000329F1FA|nr:uncharacterized protein LOC101456684 [Ceratitis capitata]